MRGRELCDAATANFVVHASWAARRNPGARVESTASLTMVDSGLRTDTFNVVCGAASGDDVPAVARRVVEHFGSVDRPFSWWVAPGDEPEDLAERLTGAGLERQETELAMALELSTVAPGRSVRTASRSGERRRPRSIATFARINAENWDPPDAAVEAFYREAAPTLLAGDSPQRSSSRSATASPWRRVELTLAAGVGGIYNLSTRARTGAGESAARCSSGVPPRRGAGRWNGRPPGVAAGRGPVSVASASAEFGLIEELKPCHS